MFTNVLPEGRRSLLLALGLALSLAGPAETGAPETVVEIRIAGEDGRSVRAAYVGIAPEDEAFKTPLREEILDGGSTVTFRVPPGRYRIACGAPGYATDYSDVFELPVAGSSARKVNLRPLAPLRGRVVDSRGAPVAGATVGHWFGFLADSARRLSSLGESHLQGNVTTTTRADGSFELPAEPGARHLVWIEAPGLAPGVLHDILFSPPEHVGPWEVRLSSGASLETTWEGVPPIEGARLLLRPKDGSADSVRQLAARLNLWERPLAGSAQRWVSLPAGTYEIWLKAPRRGTHQAIPVLLSKERLEAGTARAIPVRLPPLPPASGSREFPPLRLLANASPREIEDVEISRWDAQGPTPQAVEVRPASGGARLDLPEGCRRGVRFLVISSLTVGVVEPDQEPPCPETLPLRLFPSATASGFLRPPTGEKLPSTGLLRATRCPERPGAPAEPLGSFPFRIENGGRFQAPVPAGCLSLSFDVGDFALLSLDRLQLPEGKTRDLGIHTLQPGGALLARIVSGADGLSLDGVLVEAVPAAEIDAAVRAAFSGGRLSHEAARHGRSAQGGWVRLYGLDPGDYHLRLLPPGTRWPRFAGPFGVRGRDEAFLDDIVLPAPASLEVLLRLDDRLANEKNVRFELSARRLEREPGAPGMKIPPEAGSQDRFLFPELPPGRWEIEARAVIREGQVMLAHKEEVEVPPGEAVTSILDVKAALFRGKVTWLGDPVRGLLTLTSLPWNRGSRFGVALPEDGTFEIVLDKPGLYEAQVADAQGRFRNAKVPRVEFVDPDREIRIELPAGRLAGRVLGADGRPVAKARVEAESALDLGPEADLPGVAFTRLSATSAEDGSFALEGVAAGDWTLIARSGDRASLPHPLQLGPDERVDDIEIEISEPRRVDGLVQDPRGQPLPGVRGVVSFAPQASSELPRTASWESGPDGRFSFDAAGYLGTRASFGLTTREGVTVAVRQEIADGMVLRVPARGGDVELRLQGSRWEDVPLFSLWLVNADGSTVAPKLVGDPHGDTRSIRQLAPGRWHLVLLKGRPDLSLLMAGSGRQIPPAAVFDVQPGGQTTIDVVFKKGG